MAGVKVWPVNLTRTVQKLKKFAQALPETSQSVTRLLAEQILEDSDTIPPVVPVDTTDLQSTGRVEQSRGSGGQFSAAYSVMYGGKEGTTGRFVDYAIIVHDDTRGNIKWKRPGSGPKFVETHFIRRTAEAKSAYGSAFKMLVRTLLDGD